MRSLLLVVHVIAGLGGLTTGPVVLATVRRPDARAVAAFHWSVATVCATAAALAVLEWRSLWFFVPVAAWSYRFAFRLRAIERERGPGWRPAYLRAAGGATVALWTAVVVVSAPAIPWLWPLPAAAGIVAIEGAARRQARRPTAPA